ncbi:MAG: ATP-dependent Clp protease proteolytic subunit [Chitinispirillia bacterium]|nr:ATP-dependent Clp protease proteolytic subunit [Chitinispirillia bacterium]MCL2240998.1 ATP-dependent Clp protease proteolytic subunit [Chitinispirillia bacterium]
MAKGKDTDFLAGMKAALVGSEMEEQFLKRREIFLWGEVSDRSAEEVVKKILFLDGAGEGDITMFINSPGGVISSGLAIYDAMCSVKSDVATVVMGQAASMGAVLLCAGAAGKRAAWPHARVLIHQPLISGNMYGPASDIQIQAEEMLRTRENLNKILASHTGQTLKKITEDTDRDYFMSAEEAKKYGIVDKITQ